jgi:Gas vesicle synthesis protein GvpL/GvpF
MSARKQKQQKLWIYGVVPAGAELDELASRDGLPEVWLIELGDIAALVGEFAVEKDEQIAQQALWHAQVLEAAVRQAPVVPVAAGTVVEGGDDAVSEGLLEQHGDQFAKYLQAVEPYVQMTLKVTYEQDAVLREILDADPEIARLRESTHGRDEVESREDRIRLGELVSAGLQRLREDDAEVILSRLNEAASRLAKDELEEDFMVLNASFLVARERLDEFEAVVEEVAEEGLARMHFVLLGPMPAYSFLDAQEPSWA